MNHLRRFFLFFLIIFGSLKPVTRDEAWDAMQHGDGGRLMVEFFKENPGEVIKENDSEFLYMKVSCYYMLNVNKFVLWRFLSIMHIAAARNAHILLEYLIAERGLNPDITQKETFESMLEKTDENKTIFDRQSHNGEYEGATPLFFALVAGHMNIVRTLVHYGASLTKPVRWDFGNNGLMKILPCFMSILDTEFFMGEDAWLLLTEQQKSLYVDFKISYHDLDDGPTGSIFQCFDFVMKDFEEFLDMYFPNWADPERKYSEIIGDYISLAILMDQGDDGDLVLRVEEMSTSRILTDFLELLERFVFVATFVRYSADAQVHNDCKVAMQTATRLSKKYHHLLSLYEQVKAKRLFYSSHAGSMHNTVMHQQYFGSMMPFSIGSRISKFFSRMHDAIHEVEKHGDDNGNAPESIYLRMGIGRREQSYLNPDFIIGPLHQRTLRPRL